MKAKAGWLFVFFSVSLSLGFADSPFPPGNWPQNWSGQFAQMQPASDAKTPDGETVLRWKWGGGPAGSLPTFGSPNFAPQPMKGDVAAFWLRVDQPLDRMQVILTGAFDVGAERSITEILGEKKIEPDRWYYVAWPFRVHPGWIRYARNQMDWNQIKSMSFQTWQDQFQTPVTVEIGPVHVLTFGELERVFQKHPDWAGNVRSLSWRVLTDEKSDHMYDSYHKKRVEQAVEKLRAKVPPEVFVKEQGAIRERLAKTYLMPEIKGAPELVYTRNEKIGDVDLELQLLKIREGMYSTAVIYHPASSNNEGSAGKKYPAIFMLPGHGDPEWSGSMQDRCLGFAKQGYLVMEVEPFGQGQLGDIYNWSEGIESQSAAYLYPTGQSLMGIIMSNHRAELTHLLARPDVDATRLVVTGVSMGGTHSVWLPAIDTRITAAVPDAVGTFYYPQTSRDHLGMCDLMYGVYQVADQEMMYSLVAPRPLLHITPGVQRPVTDEGWRLYQEGKISLDELFKNYAQTPAQTAEWHHYTNAVYDLLKAPLNYVNIVVEGPHAYTKEMREAAAGFLDWAFNAHGQGTWKPIPEPPLTLVADHDQAVAMFDFWRGSQRPPEVLGPTAYVQRESSRLIAQLPPPPTDEAKWPEMKRELQKQIKECLGVETDSPGATSKEVGKARSERGVVHQCVVSPEPGIEIPFLLFEPDDGVKPDGRLVVLLHPGGMTAVSAEERQKLTAAGSRVMTVDLRGMGETRYAGESGGYIGFHDYDIACMAIKLGETLAGYWVKDLLAAVHAAQQITGGKLKAAIHAQAETGLVAILAAGQSDCIDSVETKNLLASYYSPQGYGLPFAYSDEHNNKGVRNRPLGGYGTMVPCIPNILKHADIDQLAAMLAPRSLKIDEPCWASGNPLTQKETDDAFSWSRHVYALCHANELFTIAAKK